MDSCATGYHGFVAGRRRTSEYGAEIESAGMFETA
jgi:hypothetical protein